MNFFRSVVISLASLMLINGVMSLEVNPKHVEMLDKLMQEGEYKPISSNSSLFKSLSGLMNTNSMFEGKDELQATACEYTKGTNAWDLKGMKKYKYQSTSSAHGKYTLAMCQPTEGACGQKGYSVCRDDIGIASWSQTPDATYSLISLNDPTQGVSIIFKNGEKCGGYAPVTQIQLLCSMQTTTHRFVASESSECFYHIAIMTPFGCPGYSEPEDGGLSGGWIFIIILLSVLVLYFAIGGFILYRGGARGKNLIINAAFWTAVFGYAVDGCKVVVAKIRGCVSKRPSNLVDDSTSYGTV